MCLLFPTNLSPGGCSLSLFALRADMSMPASKKPSMRKRSENQHVCFQMRKETKKENTTDDIRVQQQGPKEGQTALVELGIHRARPCGYGNTTKIIRRKNEDAAETAS